MKDIPHEHQAKSESKLDSFAIFLSATCMLHCLALPVLVTLFPIAQGSLLDEQSFHLILLVFILPTSLIALTIGCRKHKDILTIVLGAIGLSILTFTGIFGHEVFGENGERIVTTIGGLILAGAHIQNFRICRADNCKH
jgi:predicted branched-subunit amino acid permease